MDLGLKGRNTVAPAVSRGIGKAIAMTPAQEGARGPICACREPQLQAAANEICEICRNTHSSDVLAIPADLMERVDIQCFVAVVGDGE